MAGGSKTAKTPIFDNTLGVDLRSSEAQRPPGYMAAMENCVYNKANLFEKRPGFKAVATDSGPYGLAKLNIYDTTNGAITSRLVSVGTDGLKYRQTTTLTITYSGSNSCRLYLYFDPGSTQYKCKIVEGATTKIDQGLGLGFDEASTYTVAQLASAITAISGSLFSASASGSTSISAALLALTNGKVFTSSAPATLEAYYWSSVYSPVSGLFDWFNTNKDSDVFSNCVAIPYRRCLFFPNPGTFKMLKYDGHACYRAGVPTVNSLSGASVSGASATAEVTNIVCRKADATAQVETLTVVNADSGVAEVWTAEILGGSKSLFEGKYILAYDDVGSVGIWFTASAGSSAPATGASRNLRVLMDGGGAANGIAASMQRDIDADSKFSATVSSTLVTVTNASGGPRVDVAYGTVPSSKITLTTTTQGTSGYASKYFNLYDENGKVTFWMNSGSDAQPSTGAVRYVAVTYTGGSSASALGTAIKNAVDADAKFAASNVGAVVTITHSTAGDVQDGADGNAGFTFAVTTKGQDALAGKSFLTYDTNGSVLWWFSYGGATQPGYVADRYVAITTVAAAQSANTVSGHVKDAMEADSQYTATNASPPTVVATDAATGPRTDAIDIDSGFTITVATQGAGSGIGAGTYKYKATVIHKDYVGVTIEGNPTSVDVVIGDSSHDPQLTIGGVQADSGFNTGCAIVNGDQTAQTVITVDSGHTIQSGDKVYLKSGTGYVERTVSSISSTTITLDSAVTVLDNAVISSGLKIGIYRTIADGFTWFLVAEVPNDSINQTFTYHDTTLDDDLGAQYIQSPVDLSPPGSFKAACMYKGVMAGTGFSDLPDQVAFSDIDSAEYWPADTNLFDIPTANGDRGNTITGNNEVLVVGKIDGQNIGGSVTNVTGSLDEFGNYSVDTKSGSTGPSAQSGVVEIIAGTTAFPTSRGIYASVGTNIPFQISDRISPVFTKFNLANKTLALNRITAVNDTFNERLLFFISVTPNSGTRYSTTDSSVWVYDYSRAIDGQQNNRWFKWTGINAAGGFVTDGKDIYFIERRLSSFTGQVSSNLYKFHNTGTSYDFEDHQTAIPSRLAFPWFLGNQPDATSDKDFPKFKLLVSTPCDNAFDVDVSIDADFIDGSNISSGTLSVGGSFDDDLIFNIKDNRRISVRPVLSNSAHQTNWLIEGYDIQSIPIAGGALIR